MNEILDYALTGLITLFFAAATPCAIALSRRAIKWFEMKTSIDLAEQTEIAIQTAVENAAHYAEQRAKEYLKAKGERQQGSLKMNNALFSAINELESKGIGVARGEVENRIEAFLNKSGVSEAAATAVTGAVAGEIADVRHKVERKVKKKIKKILGKK